MKITLDNIKNIVLVVAVLVIIGLILFKKDPEPIIVFDNEASEIRMNKLQNSIDSLKMNTSIILINAENEKNIINSLTGKHEIDSLLNARFGFKTD